jgi:hypothetical protein
VQRFNGDGSDTTFTLAAQIANDQSILVSVDGVTQDSNAYSVSGTTLTFTAAPSSGTGNIFVNTISPVGSTVVPPDGSVTQAKVAGEAINESKLQVSNSPTNGLFLSAQSGNTGGLTWAAASAGKVLQVVQYTNANQITFPQNTSVTTEIISGAITPSLTSSKILIMSFLPLALSGGSYPAVHTSLKRGSTEIHLQQFGGYINTNNLDRRWTDTIVILDSPSSASAVTYYVYGGNATGSGFSGTYNGRANTNGNKATLTLIEIGA